MNLMLTPKDLVDLTQGRGDPVLRKILADQEKELHAAKQAVSKLQLGLAEAHDRIAALTEETATWENRIRDLERKGQGPSTAAVPA